MSQDTENGGSNYRSHVDQKEGADRVTDIQDCPAEKWGHIRVGGVQKNERVSVGLQRGLGCRGAPKSTREGTTTRKAGPTTLPAPPMLCRASKLSFWPAVYKY